MTEASKPLTLGDLTGTGRRVMAQCNRCGHAAGFTVAGLIEHGLAAATPVGDVGRHVRCSQCDSRDVITYAESPRTVRPGSERG